MAHANADAVYVLVSSDANAIPALTTLRVMGRQATAVTADVGTTATTSAAAAPAPLGTPRIHLTLADTTAPGPSAAPAAPLTAAPAESASVRAPADQAGGSSPAATAAGEAARDAAPAAHGNGSGGHVSSDGRLPGSGDSAVTSAAPKPMRLLLQQPLSVQCGVLSSSLDRVSEYNMAQLQARLRRAPQALCASEDFPHEIVAVPSLRFALVAGFAAESTWLACEKAAVLEMLLAANCWNLYAQIGALATVRRFPPVAMTVASPLLKALPLPGRCMRGMC